MPFLVNLSSYLLSQGFLHNTRSSQVVFRIARYMMENNTLPSKVLETIASPRIDSDFFRRGDALSIPYYQLRQYGLTDLAGRPAAYTSVEMDDIYGQFGLVASHQSDEQGTFGSFSLSAQGNGVSEPTVKVLVTNFRDAAAEGCDNMAQRLLNAINAVHAAGEGDMRCSNGVGSLAYLHVDDESGNEVIHIDVSFQDVDDFDPFLLLNRDFNEWRKSNPCNKSNTRANSLRDTSTSSASLLLLSTWFVGVMSAVSLIGSGLS